MSLNQVIKRKVCTIQWKIENFTYCWQKRGEVFESPVFAVDMNEATTKWKLVLCPKGFSNPRFLSFGLQRVSDSSSEEHIEIHFDLCFLSADHSPTRPVCLQSFRAVFPKSQIFLCPQFMKREDLFTLEKSNLLPQRTLTVCCNMRRVDEKITEDCQIFVRTIIQIEEVNFMWNIEKFSSLEPYHKVPFVIKSLSKGLLATLNLFMTDHCGNETIFIEIIYYHKCLKLFAIQSCILGQGGEAIKNTRQEYCFDVLSKSDKYTFLLTKRKLMESKEHYLPNDILTLKFKCTASIGIGFERIERVDLGSISFGEQGCTQQNLLESSLKDDFRFICCDDFMSDMMLRIDTDTFPVHKIILSARSPVFKSMFSTDMKEKYDKIVDITDMDSETLSRLLLYIYTDTVEDLNMESASQLYEAADKYAVLTLRNKCSTFMKDNLHSSNASQVLAVADLHSDEDLKSVVQDYIAEHHCTVLNSNGWKHLMKTDPKLASDTMFRSFN